MSHSSSVARACCAQDLDHNAVVNVSTSAQMAFVQPDGFQPEHCGRGEARTSIEFFPYFEVRDDWEEMNL